MVTLAVPTTAIIVGLASLSAALVGFWALTRSWNRAAPADNVSPPRLRDFASSHASAAGSSAPDPDASLPASDDFRTGAAAPSCVASSPSSDAGSSSDGGSD